MNAPLLNSRGWTAQLPARARALALALALSAAGFSTLQAAGLRSPPLTQPSTRLAVADLKTCRQPQWPASSLKAEHAGTVTLGFMINTKGKVVESVVKKSSGYPLLDEAARTAIAQCSFKPALQQGKPVAGWMQMQYVWTLD